MLEVELCRKDSASWIKRLTKRISAVCLVPFDIPDWQVTGEEQSWNIYNWLLITKLYSIIKLSRRLWSIWVKLKVTFKSKLSNPHLHQKKTLPKWTSNFLAPFLADFTHVQFPHSLNINFIAATSTRQSTCIFWQSTEYTVEHRLMATDWGKEVGNTVIYYGLVKKQTHV